ncbi:MAG: VOC family protein [Gammaproteobacteria bacterium]
MHRSRLSGFIIDCRTDDLDRAAEFWGAALGYPTRRESGDDKYVRLDTGPSGLHVEVQRVDHPSRVHIDIETDDIEAEVRRLESLGAKRVEKERRWWILEAPTGQRFCVVRPQKEDFADNSNVWD